MGNKVCKDVWLMPRASDEVVLLGQGWIVNDAEVLNWSIGSAVVRFEYGVSSKVKSKESTVFFVPRSWKARTL